MTPTHSTLFVSPVQPDPHGSGLQQRAFHLLCRIAESSRVTLAIATDEREFPAQHVSLPVVARILVPTQPASSPLALLLPPLVLLRRKWASGWLTPLSQPHAASFDSVVVFRLRCHDAAKMLAPSGIHRTLDLDDLESATLASIAWLALRRGRLRFAARSLASAWQYRLLECTLLSDYALVTLAKQEDADRLKLRSTHVSIEPNRVFVPPLMPRQTTELFTLLFVGTLGYYPNEDAALWIAEEIVPALRRALPCPFRVVIAGRGAGGSLRGALATVSEIELLGEVQDTACLYHKAHAVLAAVRGGGGTKIKVLEAFAHGCPVIATSHAQTGLQHIPGSSLLVADTPQQLAAHARALYDDPALAASLAAHAYAQLKALTAGVCSISRPSCKR